MINGILFALAAICIVGFVIADKIERRLQKAEVSRLRRAAVRAYERGYECGWRDGR